MQTGTLFGIGVGPGDPELITIKAINILKKVDMVFAASSTKNLHSIAETIAMPYLREGVPVEHIGFPMTTDKVRLEEAWKKNSEKILEVLKEGKDAAFITIGDPMTYSTFGYIMETIQDISPETSIKVVPGITSYHAAAAATGRIISKGEESFTVTSGAFGGESLKKAVQISDTVIVLKVYHRYKEIMETISQLNLQDKVVMVTRCGLEEEEIVVNPAYNTNASPDYLSLIIIRK